MKKIYLVLLLVAISAAAFSQKLLKPTVDKISGDTTWKTSNEAVYAKFSGLGLANNLVQIQCIRKGNSAYYLYITVTSPNEELYHTTDNSQIFIKLSDKNVIKLTVLNGSIADRIGSSSGSLDLGKVNAGTRLFEIFSCTKEDLEKLKSNSLEFLRIESSKGNLDYDIPSKSSKLLQKEAELILL